jgi:Starch binding domain
MDWMLEEGQVICVTGSIPQLGMWQQDQMLLLTGKTFLNPPGLFKPLTASEPP